MIGLLCVPLCERNSLFTTIRSSCVHQMRKFQLDESHHSLVRRNKVRELLFSSFTKKHSVDLSTEGRTKILRGQHTPEFERITNKHPRFKELEPISLSICFGTITSHCMPVLVPSLR